MRRRPILFLLTLFCACSTLAGTALADRSQFWNDGEPEVILGAYFDEAGADTILEGEVPDTLTVYLIMWNGGLRGEGPIKALEYQIEIPEGLVLVRDELPDYSNLAMGTLETGFTQAIQEQPGNGLLINTMTFLRVGELAYDARIRVLDHPETHQVRYVHRSGPRISDVEIHLLQPQDAILNPKLGSVTFTPVRSK